MGEVIQLKEKDLERTSYIDNEGDIGVSTRDRLIGVDRLNDNEFLLITPCGSQVHSRASLAEFLWVSATLLDSEEKWRPEMDLVGCDY